MPANSDLKRLLTRLKLRQIAGAKSFELGVEYFATGRVLSLAEHTGELTATVQGSDEYRVTLYVEGNSLASDCTCPMGAEGAFCKHCVAAGLAWIANGATLPRTGKQTPAVAEASLEDARAWLAKVDRHELVEMILKLAAKDARLRDRLRLEATKR